MYMFICAYGGSELVSGGEVLVLGAGDDDVAQAESCSVHSSPPLSIDLAIMSVTGHYGKISRRNNDTGCGREKKNKPRSLTSAPLNTCILPPRGARSPQCRTCGQVARPLPPVAPSPPGGDPSTRAPCLCRPLPLVCFDEGGLKVGTPATRRKTTVADQ